MAETAQPRRSIYTEDGSTIHEYLPGGKYYVAPKEATVAPGRPADPVTKVAAPAKTNG